MVSGVSREQPLQSKGPRAARQGWLLAAHRGQFAHRTAHFRNHHLLRKRPAHRDGEPDVGASFYLHHRAICQGEQAEDCPRDASADGQRADAEAAPCLAGLSAEEEDARSRMTLAGRLPGLSDTLVMLAGHLFPAFSLLILSVPSIHGAASPFADFCCQKKQQARAVALACFNPITQPHTY